MQLQCGARSRLFLLGLLICTAVGCGKSAPSSAKPAPTHADVALRVACADERDRAIVQSQSANWASQTGATLTLVAASEPADVRIIRVSELPDLVGQLRSLPAPLRQDGGNYAWADLLPDYRQVLLRWDADVYALPIVGEGSVCVYRTDRLAEKQLAPPDTWEAFATLAEQFAQADGQPSLPPVPTDDAALDRLYHEIVAPFVRRAVDQTSIKGRGFGVAEAPAQFSFHYDLATAQPRLTRVPGFAVALQLLQRLQACRPPGTSATPAEAFRTGQAVLATVTLAELATLQRSAACAGKVGVVRIPGSRRVHLTDAPTEEPQVNYVPYLGSQARLGVVAASSAHPDAAFALLAHLSGPQPAGKALSILSKPDWGAGPIRQTHLNPECQAAWDGYGLSPTTTLALRETLSRQMANAALINPAYCLRLPQAVERQAALVAAVRAALAQPQTPVAPLLQTVEEKWRAVDAPLSESARRAAVWQAVGLQAPSK
jgi:ABC-type glycerol-3-phosphate transport system substrate-binding protein